MLPKDAFASYAQRYFGGSVDFNFDEEKPDTLSFVLASFVLQVRKLADIRRQNSRGQALTVNVGVTSELHANAYADEYREQHYIGLTFGHFMSNFYLATEVFFRTNCFSDMGSVIGHEQTQIEMCPDTPFWDRNYATFMEELATITIETKDRIWGAYFLTYAMTMIAFYHEYFHVVLGHCGVKKSLGLTARMQETGKTDTSETFNQVSKSFEAIADQNAMFLSINLILSEADLPTSGNVVVISRSDRIRLTLVAAGLLSVSWHVWQQRNGEDDESHPEPGARFIHFFISAQQILAERGCGDVFEIGANQAMEDLARISVRCQDLAQAMPAIAGGRPRSDSIKPIPANIAALLEEHQYLAQV